MASRSKITALLLLIFILILCLNAFAETKVKIKGDEIKYEKQGKIAILKGNAVVNFEETVITSEELILDQDKRIVFTDKPFKILTKKDGKDTEIIGKSFEFNMDTKRLVARYASLESDAQAPEQKIYISGEEITVYNKGERITVVNGDFTTCDYIDKSKMPHYSMKASSMDFIPDDRLIAWNTAIFVAGKKTYWFPFWYIPLNNRQNDFNIDAGKNEVEGLFLNSRHYYNLNPYHDGNILLRVMEKKFLGAGFEHTWVAMPTSVSYLFAYGNPLNARYVLESDPTLRNNISPFFEDYELYFTHRQWLPFLPYAQTDFTWNKKNFYNISSIGLDRSDFDIYNVDFKDHEIFQPFKDFNIDITPNLGGDFNQTRGSGINPVTKGIEQKSFDNILNLRANSGVNINNINLNFNNTYKNEVRFNQFQNPPANPGSPATTPSANSLFKTTDSIDLNNHFVINYNLFENLNFKGDFTYKNQDHRSFSQPSAPNLPSIQNLTDEPSQDIISDISLSQNLGWGNLDLKFKNKFDFLDPDIFIKDQFGNLIDDSKLTTEQKNKKDKAIKNKKIINYLNILPELTLNADPFFKDFFPVKLEGTVGRYSETKSFSTSKLSSGLQDIVKTRFSLKADQKELDFGLGNKFSFTGTGYEQMFYQTQDSQYALTGQLNYHNDFFKFFTPTLNYRKDITDEKNNSPFAWDLLAKNKQDILSGGFGIGNIPEFTLNFGNIGYDFLNKNYLNPISLGLNSDFLAGAHFVFSAQTSYQINYVKNDDLTRVNQNFTGKDKLKTDIENKSLSDSDFSKNYVGVSRNDASKDISSLNDEQLRQKYGIDNRVYDITGKELIENRRLTEDDLGRLITRGGKFTPFTLSLGIGTPWEFDSDSFFGKEKDIPWGLGAQIRTTYDPFSEKFYKTKDANNVAKTLNSYQSYSNFLEQFQGTTLGGLVVFGGSWLTHTRIEFDLTLIQPEHVLEGQAATQTNRPAIPFNYSMSLKKDLHDFILSFDLQSNYNEGNNKRDFSFSVNFEMIAFPFNTKELSGKATQNLNNITNKIESSIQ